MFHLSFTHYREFWLTLIVMKWDGAGPDLGGASVILSRCRAGEASQGNHLTFSQSKGWIKIALGTAHARSTINPKLSNCTLTSLASHHIISVKLCLLQTILGPIVVKLKYFVLCKI